jgi:predicted small lipoprotein YifL
MMKRIFVGAAIALTLAIVFAGCGGLGPQKKPDSGQPVTSGRLYEVDMTKPEGPMMQALRAAQEKDIELFKSSFSPDIDLARIDEALFRKLRKKVLTNKVRPVVESVQQISDTEAIVKFRNGKGKEVPIHVMKVGDKWLITDVEAGKKLRDEFNKAPSGQTPAEQPPAKPAKET